MAKIRIPDENFYRQWEWAYNWIKRFRVSGNARFNNGPTGPSLHIPLPLNRPTTGTRDRGTLVKVTDPESGGGKYAGYILKAPTTVAAATGDLTEAEIGVTTNAVNCLILNVREVGKSTHDLATGGFLPLVFLGRQIGTTSDGKTIVVIDGLQWEDCT